MLVSAEDIVYLDSARRTAELKVDRNGATIVNPSSVALNTHLPILMTPALCPRTPVPSTPRTGPSTKKARTCFPPTTVTAITSRHPAWPPRHHRHQHKCTTSRAHSWGTRTNRSESSSQSSSKRSFGTGTVSSDRTELKKVNFVAASRPYSPIRPRLRDDWRQGIASDKELMDRATGKMVGIDGSANLLYDWTVAHLG